MTMLTDIRNELKRLAVTRRTIWAFMAIIVTAVALIDWLWYRFHGPVALVLALCGILVFLVGCARWRALVPLYRAWMFIALVLGWFVLRTVLIAMFIMCIIPLNMLMRLMKKDLLSRGKEDGRESYWIPAAALKDKNRYLKKF